MRRALSILRKVCSIVDMTKAGPPNATTDWDLITAQLPGDWRELAEKMGLLKEQPEQIGAKVDEIEPILRLVLYQAGASDSLRATVARAAAIGLLAISHVALHKVDEEDRSLFGGAARPNGRDGSVRPRAMARV